MNSLYPIFLFFSLFILISSSLPKDFDYIDYASSHIHDYTKRISAVKGKTNRTKCFAKVDIKTNDTLFKYDKKDVLSSETCFYPEKMEALKNISTYTNDTYEKNKMLLAFCIYHVLIDPEFVIQISEEDKFKIQSLPLKEVEHSELLFDYPDINEFLLAGTTYYVEEPDRIENIIAKNLQILDRYNKNFKLYTNIYYYVITHSFNINGEAVILPFMEVCDMVPYYLTKPDLNYSNSTFVEEEGNKILVKSSRNFRQSEQFLFSFNVSLDNDALMLKHGIYVHDNLHDYYLINKKFSYDNNYFNDMLYNTLKKRNLHPNIFNYHRENLGVDGWYQFKLRGNKIDDLLYRFSIIYFHWWAMQHNDQNIVYRTIAKRAMTFIMRMCYDEIEKIKGRMDCDFDDYLLRTQMDDSLSEINKKLRNFTMEKVHLINKNVNWLLEDLVLINYNEIRDKRDFYTYVDPNKDV
jgi:hypothetical protein